MAINPIYRESWQKANGWNVRVDFIAGGGEAAKHGDRSVTAINSVYKDVAGHKASFSDGIPFGLADAESCTFLVDYTLAPAGMKSALVQQNATVADAYFGSVTAGKYRTPRYMPQAVSGTKPKQPNLFMVWSDRGTSNGVVTGLSIAYGGYGWEFDDNGVATEPYFPGAMDTVIGSGLTIDFTVVDSVIATVTVHNGGTGYKVGQQVKYVDLLHPERFAYFTITSVASPTWYIEFMGCQRLTPSTKYKADTRGLEIEIEAIGIHKIAMESITDLTTFTRSYIGSQIDGSGPAVYNAPRSTKDIVDFDYVYGLTRYKMYSSSPLLHYHAPIASLWGYMQDAFDEAFEFYSMEGYQGLFDNATNLAGVYPTTSSNIKLMRQALFSSYGTNVELGQTNGSMHDTSTELSEIRFIFCVTKDDRGDYYSPDSWAGGLFTDFEDGIRKDCDSAWDLLKKLAEQFWLKITPYYEFASGLMKAKWNVTEPYGSISGYGVETIAYNATRGDAAFETNAETRESIKHHYYATGNDVDSVEVTSFTKSGKKIECNHIFDIRVRTAPDGTDFDIRAGRDNADKFIEIPYARLRGLYAMTSTSGLVAVSPRINITCVGILGTTLSTTTPNVYARTSDVKNPNYVLHDPLFPLRSADAFMIRVRELQEDRTNGFGYVALVLSCYFGVGSTDYILTDTNNQTSYEMELPLSTTRLPERIGQRTDITPHAALTSQVSPKAYLIDLEISWSARDTDASFVKVKYLTRSILFN